ncbi:MAG: 4Fe-4S dicluster domain-containing protein [Candidatus Kapabacteria bacterium]|jgi:heterodisulfide reductase subunit C|nr:4Fe-4S dicluster domain-containing protein [Candidatus Kapabacteria bacterium]
MQKTVLFEVPEFSLRKKVEHITGESVNECYQCGKCTAGCPLNDEFDVLPNQILRMLQLDMPDLDDKILRSYTIWLCLACETCSSRCPKEVDLPQVMDYLRSESIKQDKVNPKAKDIVSFHKSFLQTVRGSGRLHEVGLIAGYKLRSLHLFQDVESAPKLYLDGKLSIFPHNIHNRQVIENIFKKSEEIGGSSI